MNIKRLKVKVRMREEAALAEGFKPPHPDRFCTPRGTSLKGRGLPFAIMKKRAEDIRQQMHFIDDAQRLDAAIINQAHRHSTSRSAGRRYWKKEERIVGAWKRRLTQESMDSWSERASR